MNSEDQISARWQELVDKQALVPDGVDEDGDIIYIIDADKLKEVDPVLFQAYIDDLDETIISLANRGFLEMYIDDEGEFAFTPAPGVVEWVKTLEQQ